MELFASLFFTLVLLEIGSQLFVILYVKKPFLFVVFKFYVYINAKLNPFKYQLLTFYFPSCCLLTHRTYLFWWFSALLRCVWVERSLDYARHWITCKEVSLPPWNGVVLVMKLNLIWWWGFNSGDLKVLLYYHYDQVFNLSVAVHTLPMHTALLSRIGTSKLVFFFFFVFNAEIYFETSSIYEIEKNVKIFKFFCKIWFLLGTPSYNIILWLDLLYFVIVVIYFDTLITRAKTCEMAAIFHVQDQ